MEGRFKSVTESSMGFIIKMNKNGVYMDVKNIILLSSGKKMFQFEHVQYLMVLNMTNTCRVEMDKEFKDFIIEQVGLSRAYLYKILSVMVECKMIDRLEKRGWYKMNGINLRKRLK